uniref:YTH domain-containing family protein n=1 Tax=Daucus carota subsp. sativus TaxID=79200 RepID=A0A162B070_DAUCS
MSPDTGKGYTSVADSSLTETKHDKRNLDFSESPKYKVDRHAYSFKKQEQGYSCEQVGTSGAKKHRTIGTRYFIIKSLNHENIQLSIEKGIWATQLMNEPILEEAFHNSGKVILIFSVNMSGSFQGYAQMMSPVGWRRDKVWSAGSGGNNQWGRSFKVKWLQLHDLPFQKTLHLKNPLNQFKPVKISRDCQELPQDIGEALCELLDRKIDNNDKQIRDYPSFERPHVEPSWSVRDEEFNFPHMPRTGGLYPSLFYQHQLESSRTHFAHQRSAQTYLCDNSPVASGSPRMACSELSHVKGGEMNVDSDHGCSSQLDIWRFSAEGSSVGSALTDDDILEMVLLRHLNSLLLIILSSCKTKGCYYGL